MNPLPNKRHIPYFDCSDSQPSGPDGFYLVRTCKWKFLVHELQLGWSCLVDSSRELANLAQNRIVFQ